MDYKVGDVIEYTTHLGGTRRVTVTATYTDVKNGRPGFDGELVEGAETILGTADVWGYDDQITRVVARA